MMYLGHRSRATKERKMSEKQAEEYFRELTGAGKIIGGINGRCDGENIIKTIYFIISYYTLYLFLCQDNIHNHYNHTFTTLLFTQYSHIIALNIGTQIGNHYN